MRVTFYTAVLIVAAGSVVLGLDWVPAPMQAMPESRNIVFAPPPPPPAPRVSAPVAPPPATPPSAQTAPAPQASASAPPVPVAAAPPVQTPVVPPPAIAAPRVKCDVDACAAAYRSFRDSDCTYNPSFGPRRLCTKGDPERYAREHPEAAAPAATPAPPPVAPPVAQTTEPGASTTPSIMAPEPGAIVAPEPGTTPAATPAPRCNVSACRAAYPGSFREEDCTFNPGSGPRRVCEK